MTTIKSFLRNLRRRLAEHGNVMEMSRCASADFGASTSDLENALTMKMDLPERMERMSAVFGASHAVARADRWQLLDMARACNRCEHRHACSRALHCKDPAQPQDVAFCPNADEYRTLAALDAA